MTDTRADTLNIHAIWCAGGCPRWLATGAPTCMPYPCRCAETKANAPEWKRTDPGLTCWWRNRVGKLTSRCPCWGETRRNQPADCCVWHLANPQYLDEPTEAYLALMDPEQAAAQMMEPEDTQTARPADADAVVWDDERPYEAERPKAPVVRRWTPRELVCEHDVSAIKGIHCQECHVVWANDMVFGMHRATWWSPCRAPGDLVDIDTGVLLILQRADGAWAIDWAANLHLWEAAKRRAGPPPAQTVA